MSTSDKAGDKAGEASMDEILASIRKIIADDPLAPRSGNGAGDRARDSRALNPLLEPAAPQLRTYDGSDGSKPLLPPLARFGDQLNIATEALRPALEPLPSAAPPRARPFAEQALSGMFADDAPPTPVIQKPPSSLDTPPPMTAGEPALESLDPQSPDPWAAWRSLRPSAAADTKSELQQPAQKTAQPSPVTTPPVQAPPEAAGTAGSNESSAVNGHAAADSPEPVMQSPELQRSEPVSSAKGAKQTFYPPPATSPVRRQPASFSSVFPRATARSAPAVPSPAAAQGSGGASSPAPRKGDEMMPSSAPLAAAAAAGLNGSAPPMTAPETVAHSAEIATAAAASQALEKLAAGLSGTAAVEPQLQSAAPVPASHPRTLDDMVSDMLRPMLEKWVDTNMPRLMEKALRPPSTKDAGPPPGSNK